MTVAGQEHRYISALTPIRGVAALGIVLFHALIAFGAPPAVLLRAELLKIVVTFFFILSGFVLTYSWGKDSSRTTFWLRRAARLIPLYLLVWLITLAGRSWLHWESSQSELAATLLLVQAWWPNEQLSLAVNPPAWSLSCEALLYLLLPLAAPRILSMTRRARRHMTEAAAAWLLLAVCMSWLVPLEWWVGYRASEFALGVLLAAHVGAGWRPGTTMQRTAFVSTAAVVLLASTGVPVTGPVANLVATPAFVFIVSWVATNKATAHRRWLDNAATQALGRWSYALYISHWIIVVLMSRFLTSATWIPAAIIFCVLAAAILHRLVERPAERRILQLRGNTKSGSAPLPTAAADHALPHLL